MSSPLILASTSRYRRDLLARLRLPFLVESPGVDETPAAAEAPAPLAVRLALAKAEAVAAMHPQALVIGSDQVAELNGQALGKPGSHEAATAQLRKMRGKTVTFHTAVAICCVERQLRLQDCAIVRATFRALDDAAIERYLLAEQPYDCAGSAKSEGLGIALLESIESDDPTALVGLPLIRVAQMLRRAGLQIP